MNNKKKRIIVILISIILFISFLTVVINVYMVNSTKGQIVDINELDNDIDAIIILGCKIDGDSPSLMLSKRLIKGVDVYNKLHTRIILSGSHRGNDYDETIVMKNYIINDGIDKSDIYLDNDGHTTYDSIYRAKNILKAKKVVIVTQRYHIYRALYLANKLDLDAVGVVADDIPQKFILLKNKVREVFSRDKNYFKALFNAKSSYTSDYIKVKD